MVHLILAKEEVAKLQSENRLRAFLADIRPYDDINQRECRFQMDLPIEQDIVTGKFGEAVVFWQEELGDEE